MVYTKAQFEIHNPDGSTAQISLQGRLRWALENLIRAGETGITPIDAPAPRWSAYVHQLRHESGVAIETAREPHGGLFPGRHARYRLACRAAPVTP
jgi:hypothetical protein